MCQRETAGSLVNILNFFIPACEYFTGQSEELPVLFSPRFAGHAAAHMCETHEGINAHKFQVCA